MSNEVIHIIIFLASVLVASFSQVLLKTSADREYEHWYQEYLNVKVIVAYGLFFVSTIITVVAYKYVPLSLGPVLESSGYVFVTLLGYFVLKEKIRSKKLIGMIVIIVGIILFSV